MRSHMWIFWLSFGITIGLAFAMVCFNKLLRKVPINYILLFTFTIVESYLIASVTSYQKTENVVIASVLTFGMFLGLTCFAFFVIFLLLKS